VQQRGLQCRHVELQLRARHRGREGMLNVRMPGTTQMALVLLLGVLVRRQHQVAIHRREILLQHIDQHVDRRVLRQVDNFRGHGLRCHNSIIQSEIVYLRTPYDRGVNSTRVCTMTFEDRT